MDLVIAMLIVLLVAVLLAWFGIIALATPTVVYRFDRRFDLRSNEFAQALSSAFATCRRSTTPTWREVSN